MSKEPKNIVEWLRMAMEHNDSLRITERTKRSAARWAKAQKAVEANDESACRDYAIVMLDNSDELLKHGHRRFMEMDTMYHQGCVLLKRKPKPNLPEQSP